MPLSGSSWSAVAQESTLAWQCYAIDSSYPAGAVALVGCNENDKGGNDNKIGANTCWLEDEASLNQNRTVLSNDSADFPPNWRNVLWSYDDAADAATASDYQTSQNSDELLRERSESINTTRAMGDFHSRENLSPAQLEQVRWRAGDDTVSDYSYEIGLDPVVRQTLLEYANHMGVTETFRDLLIDGEPLEEGTDEYIVLQGHNWYIERPDNHWNSNMHWISPRDEPAHDDFLRTLGSTGFDRYLDALGKHFGLDGLVVYHLTFIAVTHCQEGYVHRDFGGVDGKAFNIIVPLMLVNETEPELKLVQDDDDDRVGAYKYRYNVGSIVGDYTYHATANCDYRGTGQMRMAATIYLADVNVHNLHALLDSFTQLYPPADATHLYQRKGRHWSPTDPNKKLPDQLLVNDPPMGSVQTGQMEQLMWQNGQIALHNLFYIRLPLNFQTALLDFANDAAVLPTLANLIVEGKSRYQPGNYGHLTGHNDDNEEWYIARPPPDEDSDLHTLSPAEPVSFEQVLCAMSHGGFDDVLESIGNRLQLESLTVYEVTFFAVHRYAPSHQSIRWDSKRLGKNMLELVVPLVLVDDVGPEMLVQRANVHSPKTTTTAAATEGVLHYKHQNDFGVVFVGEGDFVVGMAPHDYEVQQQMHVGMSIRLAEITEENMNQVLDSLTQDYPPVDPIHLWNNFAGWHWNKSDPSIHLPQWEEEEEEEEDN